jgi:hypothetical protein
MSEQPGTVLRIPQVDPTVFDGRLREEIITDSDKIRICLNNYRNVVKWQRDWLGIFGLTLTLLLAILTSDFKDTLGISSGTWKTVVYIALFISAILNSRSIIINIYYKDKSNIEHFVNRIKEGSSMIQEEPSLVSVFEDIILRKRSN